jgi:hypothetical protein
MTVLTPYTEWPEELWSGLPLPPCARPCPPSPPTRPFVLGAVAAGKPLRSFADLDRANDRDLSPRLRDLRDDPRGYSKRTGRPYPSAFRQFQVIGSWGQYVRRIPPPADDPWLPVIEAFLSDKTIVTSTEIWLHGCPPAGHRRAFRRIAPIMRYLGWRRWRTDFAAFWLHPGLATPKRSQLRKPPAYGRGKKPSAACVQPPRRPSVHLQDLDRREANLAAWVNERITHDPTGGS